MVPLLSPAQTGDALQCPEEAGIGEGSMNRYRTSFTVALMAASALAMPQSALAKSHDDDIEARLARLEAEADAYWASRR